ncbi:MAG: hypothetical protein HY558_07410 [Euryarchaeota archaeon]|nr:hypothetical protein [Euryarchaeota archaeon]
MPELAAAAEKRSDVFNRASTSRVVAGGSWQIIPGFAGGMLLFAWVLLGSRTYGAARFEYFITAQALLQVLTFPAIGLGLTFMRYVSAALTRSPEEARTTAGQAAQVFLITGAALMALLLLFIYGVVPKPLDQVSFTLLALIIPLVYIRDILTSTIGSAARFDYVGVVGALFGVGIFGTGLLLISTGDPLSRAHFLSLTLVGGIAVTALMALLLVGRVSPFPVRGLFRVGLTRGFAREFASYGLYTCLANVATFGIILQLSVLGVKSLNYMGVLSEAAVGIYGISTLGAYIVTLITIMAVPMVPEVSRAREVGDKALVDSIVKTMLKLCLSIGVLIATIFTVFSQVVLAVLLPRGDQAAALLLGGHEAVALTTIGMVLYAVATILGATLVGTGQARYAGAWLGLGALLTAAGTIPLALLAGLPGAALMLPLSALVILPPLMHRMRRTLGTRLSWGLFLRPLAAAAIVSLVFSPLTSRVLGAGGIASTLLTVALSFNLLLLVFAILLTLLGFYDEEDYRMIEDIFTSFGMRPIGRFAGRAFRALHRRSPLAPPL